MLEGLAKGSPQALLVSDRIGGQTLTDVVSVRAASYLVRDHGRSDMKQALLDCAQNAKRDELRGLAVAALWDAGARDKASALADELVTSRVIGNVAWSALVRAAAARSQTSGVHEPVLGETPLRWIQWGWLE